MSGTPVYPNISVRLIGIDNHPMTIVAALTRGLRDGGIGRDEIDRIMREALSGDYDHVLATCLKYVRVY
ncbi:MAG: hypothetical protein WA973_14595 [Mesorhizobium sp.]